MTVTIEKQREAGEAVLQAALAWWEMHRPAGWDLRQHLNCPGVNMPTESDQMLAQAVASAVEVGRV